MCVCVCACGPIRVVENLFFCTVKCFFLCQCEPAREVNCQCIHEIYRDKMFPAIFHSRSARLRQIVLNEALGGTHNRGGTHALARMRKHACTGRQVIRFVCFVCFLHVFVILAALTLTRIPAFPARGGDWRKHAFPHTCEHRTSSSN